MSEKCGIIFLNNDRFSESMDDNAVREFHFNTCLKMANLAIEMRLELSEPPLNFYYHRQGLYQFALRALDGLYYPVFMDGEQILLPTQELRDLTVWADERIEELFGIRPK